MIMQNPDLSTNLLRCTLKKSLHTTERLVLAAAYVIDVVALLACGFLLGEVILPAIVACIAFVIALIFSIPWYFYVIAAIPVAIVGYSFLWCVARELTEEDWKSDMAAAVAIATAVDPVDKITVWYYVFRFYGAAYHHCRGTRG